MNRKVFRTLALICILAISCTKSKDDSPNANQVRQPGANARLTTEQQNYIDNVGDQHTKGLEFAYNHLAALKASSPEVFNSATTLSAACKNSLHAFYTTNELDWLQSNSSALISESDDAYDQFYARGHSDPYYYHTHDLWEPDQDAALSAPVKALLTSLKAIALDSMKTVEQSLAELSALEDSANARLVNTTELALVLSATSVAKSSLTYWNDNYGRWRTLIGNVAGKTTAPSNAGRNAGIADIAGVVTTAARLGIMALFGPVGAVAFFSGVISVGISASIGTALVTILAEHK